MIDLSGIDTFAELAKARQELEEEFKKEHPNEDLFPARTSLIENEEPTDRSFIAMDNEKRDFNKLVYERFYENVRKKKESEKL